MPFKWEPACLLVPVRSSHNSSRFASVFNTRAVIADERLLLRLNVTTQAVGHHETGKPYRIRHVKQAQEEGPPEKRVRRRSVGVECARSLGKSSDVDGIQVSEDGEDDLGRCVEEAIGCR